MPPILIDMEDFSTPRRRLVPWAANLATLAVMVAAVGWSGAQRPNAREVALSQPQPAPAIAAPAQPSPSLKPGLWPVSGHVVAQDTLQPVAYQPSSLR